MIELKDLPPFPYGEVAPREFIEAANRVLAAIRREREPLAHDQFRMRAVVFQPQLTAPVLSPAVVGEAEAHVPEYRAWRERLSTMSRRPRQRPSGRTVIRRHPEEWRATI